MRFDIPDQDKREFMSLPLATRERVLHQLALMHRIHTAPRALAACREIAQILKNHTNTIYAAWKAFKKSRGDWRTLIDRRHTPEFWQTTSRKNLPHAFLEHWKTLCERNQRACAPAHHSLLLSLHHWRAGDTSHAIPGYLTPPPNAAGSSYPLGWSLSNLMRHRPSDIELAAARNGRTAAKNLLPAVFTTRAQMHPYQEIQFDDMWHDFRVLAPGHPGPVRLLEFGAIDVCTGYLFPPGLKPRIKNTDTGKFQHLLEREFRIYVVNFLATIGWSPNGTKLLGERGTAAFRHLAPKISHWTRGLVTTATGGMSGAPARAGDYSERAKGNFKAKALKEGAGKLIHNRLAHLPGQVGMHRDDLPASDHGREIETLKLTALQPYLPLELSAALQIGHVTLSIAVDAIYRAYAAINARTDHNLEGWDALGYVVEQFRAGSDIWLPLASAAALPDPQRHALTAALHLDPTLLRRHRLSPTQAIKTAPSNIRLTAEAEADMLLTDCGTGRTVIDGLFTFNDSDIGPSKFRFLATYKDSSGFTRRLENGTRAITVLNPFNPTRLFLFSATDKRYLGIAQPWTAADRTDVDSIMELNGAAAREYKAALLEAEKRHGITKHDRLTHNTTILRAHTTLPAASSSRNLSASHLLDNQADQVSDPAFPTFALDSSSFL